MKKPNSAGLAPAAHWLVTIAVALAGCGKQPPEANGFTPVTPNNHLAFSISSGSHALDCAACHGTFPSFKQFDCVSCHSSGPTAAVHTTTVTPAGYLTDSQSCYACHKDTDAHPFDHQGITACASCHAQGSFYAALPQPAFTHPDIGIDDCSTCHKPASWWNPNAPAGFTSDPSAAVTLTALMPRFALTSVVAVAPQVQVLPMEMDHASTAVNMGGLACTACHGSANGRAYFPGLLHSSLATLSQPAPVSCAGCHASSVPVGFVGPVAVKPARHPASGEMRHDAVAWVGGLPAGGPLVTADCAVCHLSPTALVAATWATGRGGTAPTRYHASLTTGGIQQPASCLDCHANTRPAGTITAPAAALALGLAFDHASAAALADCAACHAGGISTWAGGKHHLAGSATPASCLPCHDGQRPTTTAGWTSAGYAATPFDFGTNAAGITHGAGDDCAGCHAGPGTGGSWGGAQRWTGGYFTHGPGTASETSCIACHMSQRPDLVLGATIATARLGFDHASSGTGDCIGCHEATVVAGSYSRYFGAVASANSTDWAGGKFYPGSQPISAPNQFVTLTELTLVRPSPGGLVTGMTSRLATHYGVMVHTSPLIPAQVSPGPAASPDPASCWHCHAHDAAGAITGYANATFHVALAAYSATLGGPVTPLPQPTGCLDCHSRMRPAGIVEAAASTLQPMDHQATFTGVAIIGSQTVTSVAQVDCSACHAIAGTRWSDGNFHARIGAATPADCVVCHYPLMADPVWADVTNATRYAMSHRSAQLPTQACSACHTGALAASTALPSTAAAWAPGNLHGSLPAQPTSCLDCHLVSEPAAGDSRQGSVTYTLPSGGTSSNGAQWMNHGAPPVIGLDCVSCHAADARPTGSAWSKTSRYHLQAPRPAVCQSCHGLQNGGGGVPGTNNNMPAGLNDSSTVTTASANALTGVPAGTRDQITHGDANVTGHDCGSCHSQSGPSTVVGIQGREWAQARFHASFGAAMPLLLNGTTGRCSNCHLNLKPGPSFTLYNHAALTGASGSPDCSSCHSWPGTGSATTPNWRGASAMPPFIAVGGFTIPTPPAAAAGTTQTGITNLPHPTIAALASCATCHTGGVGGKRAIGYDHASALINSNCSSCHEAGSNLLGTPWNGATTQAAGAGDTRPFTLTTVLAQRGTGGGTCNITSVSHFYPTQCGECHAVPAGNGLVTTGAAYKAAWYFPHTERNMANPATCNKCHVGQGCSK